MTEPLTAYLTSRYLGWALIALVAWTLLPHLFRLGLTRELNWRALARAPEWGLFVGILAVLALIYRLDTHGAFFSSYSDENLIHNVALFGMLSLGAAIVIIAGGIDLSVGSLVALSAVVAAQLMTSWIRGLASLEALGATRLGLSALGASLLLGFWPVGRGERRRPWTVAILSLALASVAALLLGTMLESWETSLTVGGRSMVVGLVAGLAIVAQGLGLVSARRDGGKDAVLVTIAALIFTIAAGLAPFARGIGPLETWGSTAKLAMIVGVSAATFLIGLALGLRRGAGLLTLAVGLVVTMGLTTPIPESPQQEPFWLIVTAITLTSLLGLAIGLVHALMINALRLPPFIATLATLAGLRSLAIILGENRSINVRFDSFNDFGKENVYTVSIFVVVALLMSLLMGASVLGRHLYALGGNEAAARLSGLPTRRLKSVAYGLSGLLAALGGLLFLGNTGSVQPATTGATYELYAITAAVVGGCSLAGGVGSIRGTVLGLILIQIVIKGTGIVVRGIDSTQIEGLVLGTVVVLAVGFNERFRVRRL